MASVFELARQLGEEMQKTPQVEALLSAKKAYEEDENISKAVAEYTKMHEDFQAKIQSGGIAPEEQKKFTEEMRERGEYIKNNQLAADLYTAEMNFNNFVNSVFNIVTATMAGEDPAEAGGCSPSCCETCGGGCH